MGANIVIVKAKNPCASTIYENFVLAEIPSL